jgi:hypothetical protein
LALSVSTVAVAAPHPTCTLYQDRDFGGSHWVLLNGDDLQMINPPSVGTSDAVHRYLYNASWNDQVSSFRVSPGCTLTLWEDVGKGGHYFRSNRSYSYVGSAWNDKASEALCECQVAGGANY